MWECLLQGAELLLLTIKAINLSSSGLPSSIPTPCMCAHLAESAVIVPGDLGDTYHWCKHGALATAFVASNKVLCVSPGSPLSASVNLWQVNL